MDKRGLPGDQLKEGEEMDGGIVERDGKKFRVVLNHLGVFKEHREVKPGERVRTGGSAGGASSMETATDRALKGGTPAGVNLKPGQGGKEGKGEGAGAGEGEGAGQGAGGFKLPT